MAGLGKDLRGFLSQAIIARLGTSHDGQPYVVPVWFHYDGEAFWVIARSRSEYVRHIQANPRVALSIARDDGDLSRVLVLGRAEIVEGPSRTGRWRELGRAMARRYLGEQGGEAYFQRTINQPRYLIRIVPQTLRSWRGRGQWHPRYYVGEDGEGAPH